jgi:hypothetical protein
MVQLEAVDAVRSPLLSFGYRLARAHFSALGAGFFSDLSGPVRRLDRSIQLTPLLGQPLQLLAQRAHVHRRDLANL